MEGEGSDLADLSEAALMARLDAWLGPYLAGVRSKGDMQKLDWSAILRGCLTWQQQQRVEREAPSHLKLPIGSKVPIDYSRDTLTVSVRIQVRELRSKALSAGCPWGEIDPEVERGN